MARFALKTSKQLENMATAMSTNIKYTKTETKHTKTETETISKIILSALDEINASCEEEVPDTTVEAVKSITHTLIIQLFPTSGIDMYALENLLTSVFDFWKDAGIKPIKVNDKN